MDNLSTQNYSGALVITDIKNSTMLWSHNADKMAKTIHLQNKIMNACLDALIKKCKMCVKLNEIGDSWELIIVDDNSCVIAFQWAILVQYFINKFLSDIKVRIGMHFGKFNLHCFTVVDQCEIMNSIFTNETKTMESHGDGGGINMSGEFINNFNQQIMMTTKFDINVIRKYILRQLTEHELTPPYKSDDEVIFIFIRVKPEYLNDFISDIRKSYIKIVSTEEEGYVWNFIATDHNQLVSFYESITIPNDQWKSGFHKGKYYYITNGSSSKSEFAKTFERYVSHSQNIAARLLARANFGDIYSIEDIPGHHSECVRLVEPLKGLSYECIKKIIV